MYLLIIDAKWFLLEYFYNTQFANIYSVQSISYLFQLPFLKSQNFQDMMFKCGKLMLSVSCRDQSNQFQPSQGRRNRGGKGAFAPHPRFFKISRLCPPHQGSSINDVRQFLTIFDPPSLPYVRFLPSNVQFFGVISDLPSPPKIGHH